MKKQKKMSQILKIKKTIFAFIAIVVSTSIFAQDDPGFPGGDPGAPQAPIDNWIPIMLFAGVGIVFYYYSRRKKSI